MTVKLLTDKVMREWRSGLHAAHPSEAQALVAEIDRLREENEKLKKPTQNPTV